MAKLGSVEWWKAHAKLLNANETYRKYAKGLTTVFEYNVGDMRTIARYENGEIVDVHAPAKGEEGIMIIAAPREIWANLASGRLDPKAALMGGKLRFRKGNMASLARYMAAAGAIFAAMAKIPTDD
ncbi:MAG TPA: SCP2 sterol-binding domain-containing protein [Anaerovoracaceae bacterium]|nr:SCP2 sterol-binding domain-containing protein [Anaerovoracaceae bacterium]